MNNSKYSGNQVVVLGASTNSTKKQVIEKLELKLKKLGECDLFSEEWRKHEDSFIDALWSKDVQKNLDESEFEYYNKEYNLIGVLK